MYVCPYVFSCSWVQINFSGDLLYHIYMMSFTSYGMSEHAKVIMKSYFAVDIQFAEYFFVLVY